jgi:cytochrome c
MKMLLHVLLLALGTVAVASADEPVSDATGMKLMTKYGCQACHTIQNNPSMQGPSLRAIAHKYASDPEERTDVEANILNGSSGAWGSNTMPAFSIPPGDLRTLVDWILGQWP